MTLDLNLIGAAMGSWLLTWLLHPTVLLSAAALASMVPRRRPEIEETLWKTVLVGALLTATRTWWPGPPGRAAADGSPG